MGGPGDRQTRIDGGHQPPDAGDRPDSRVNESGTVSRIGLIAGWGRYPIVVAETLKRQGYAVYCLAVVGEADPALADVCDDLRWIGPAKLGRALRHFKRWGITRATMAGKIHKVGLFRPWRWLRYLPDLRTIRMFFPHFVSRRQDCRDDTLLRAIVNAFASDGIHFAPATDFAPDLLAGQGQLTRRGPSAAEWQDVEFGWHIAKEMGRLDIGQSVVVKDRAVLAIEAVEGTDQCIRRAGTLCTAGGFTVVKVAKPQQDMRFDVPTIGRGTLETMIAAGGRVLAIEAERTIILDQAELIDFADRNGLILVATGSAGHGPVDPRPSEGDAVASCGANVRRVAGLPREG